MYSAPFGSGEFFILNHKMEIVYISKRANYREYKLGDVAEFATISLESDIDNLIKESPKEMKNLIKKYPEWFI